MRALIGLIFGCLIASIALQASVPTTSMSEEAPALLHPIERIAFSTDWRESTQRRGRVGDTVFVILRTGMVSCAIIKTEQDGVSLWQMLPMDLDVASDENTKPGRYHEVLVPRNAAVCNRSRYVLAEWAIGQNPSKVTFEIEGRKLVVDETLDTRPQPTRPFYVGLDNRGLLDAHCGGYCQREGELGRIYAAQLITHGLQPIRNWIGLPPLRDGTLDLNHASAKGYSFSQTGLQTAISGQVIFPRAELYEDPEAYLVALERTVKEQGLAGRAWIYAADEPAQPLRLIPRLKKYKQLAPSVRIMVTTPPSKELEGLVDIFAPVFNSLKSHSWSGKDIWTYVSCMGSCGPNRVTSKDSAKIPGPDTQLPDMLIDRPASRLFVLFTEAEERNLGAVLYYAATEGYRLLPQGVDLLADPFNFGGNGDGLLLFPGRAGTLGLNQDMALPSFRLKLIRYAIQTYW